MLIPVRQDRDIFYLIIWKYKGNSLPIYTQSHRFFYKYSIASIKSGRLKETAYSSYHPVYHLAPSSCVKKVFSTNKSVGVPVVAQQK